MNWDGAVTYYFNCEKVSTYSFCERDYCLFANGDFIILFSSPQEFGMIHLNIGFSGVASIVSFFQQNTIIPHFHQQNCLR